MHIHLLPPDSCCCRNHHQFCSQNCMAVVSAAAAGKGQGSGEKANNRLRSEIIRTAAAAFSHRVVARHSERKGTPKLSIVLHLQGEDEELTQKSPHPIST
jgi:hypothetical protein